MLQQVFPPALTDGSRPLGGLWWWPTMRWGRARRSLGARDFVAIRIHAPAEASAAMTLQGQEVALLVTLRDVEPGPRVGMLCLGIALLVFTGLQSRGGVRCALKSIPVISRLAVAGEGARGIVAGSCRVTSVFCTFINIGTLASIASITW